MYGDMQRYYARNKFFLSQVGGWPYQPKIVKVLLLCLMIVVEISFLVSEVKVECVNRAYDHVLAKDRLSDVAAQISEDYQDYLVFFPSSCLTSYLIIGC